LIGNIKERGWLFGKVFIENLFYFLYSYFIVFFLTAYFKLIVLFLFCIPRFLPHRRKK